MTKATAKGNLNIIANGGSLNSEGAKLSAEADALLHATENIKLGFAKDHQDQNVQSKQSGFSVDNRDWAAPAGVYNNQNQGIGKADQVKGSTTIGLNSSGQETEQLTKATLGQGTITNAATGTNRDINNTQEITRNQTTGMLNGSVTVDHRLLSESGRAEIVKEQQKVSEDVKEIVSNTNMVIGGVKGGIELQTRIEQENQKLSADDQLLFGNLIIELSKSKEVDSTDSYYPVIVGAGEAFAMAAGACAKSPACASAVVNALGAVGVAILSEQSEDKDKKSTPKPLPSTSGNSATGMPPNGDDEFKRPNSDLEKNDRIDLSTFNKGKFEGQNVYIDKRTGYMVTRDRAGANSHGGSYWKLLDKNGNRVATLTQEGKVLRK